MTDSQQKKDTSNQSETTNPFQASIQANMQLWQDSMNVFTQFAQNMQPTPQADNNHHTFSAFSTFFAQPKQPNNSSEQSTNESHNPNSNHQKTNNNQNTPDQDTPDQDTSNFENLNNKNTLNDNLTELAGRFFNQTMRMTSTQGGSTGQSVMMDFMEGWQKLASEAIERNPSALLEQHMTLWQQQLQLYQNTMMKMTGNATEPVIEPNKGDKRFKDEDWNNNPAFDFLKQSYLLTSKNMMDTIKNAQGMDEKTRQRLSFFTRQWLNAVAPSNFLWSNPEVLRLTLETGGQNLMQGLKQLTEDMEKSSDVLSIRMTDQTAFRLGDNIATTAGKVVFRNRMMELIQYTPTTEKVSKRPLLIVPPWINKFYIMDLKEKNSYIKWALDEGHSVFIISWVNPTREYKHVGMDTYMHEGLLTALDTIQTITGEPDANVIGYCIGGWLLALTLSWLTENDQAERIASATFWTTIFDFSDPGDIGVFIDEKIVSAIQQEEEKQGVFDGRMMAVAFSLLRENSLYWNYYIQNYLKGERPIAFDLLYWNSDCTNVTADLHQFVLRELYLNNQLIKQGELEFDGIKIDLSKVTIPVYVVSTLQDHIAKWKGCYQSTQVLGGDVTFVLGESGHIAGIMNPPTGKYGYYADKPKPKTAQNTSINYPTEAEDWFETAEKYDESWWLHWSNWINKFRGEEIDARQVGTDHTGKQWQTLGDAPGTYVHVKAEEALKMA